MLKKMILTITIILIMISTTANAQVRRARPWTQGGRQQAYRQRAINRHAPYSVGRYSRPYRYNSTARKVANIGRVITDVADIISVVSGDRGHRTPSQRNMRIGRW